MKKIELVVSIVMIAIFIAASAIGIYAMVQEARSYEAFSPMIINDVPGPNDSAILPR